MKNAPSFTPGQWPNFTDEQFANTIYKYYGLTPYWERGGVVRTTGETPGMTENYRMRWNERPVAWQKLSDLCGKEVGTAETENVGKLNDLAIDPDQGRILYGILSYGGKFFALPWATLTLTDDSQRFVLHTAKSQLNDEVAFTKDNWPNLTNPGYAMGTYEHYKVQPYWTAPLGEPTVRR